MIDSVWVGSVVVGDEASDWVVEVAGFPELPVVPDAGSEREQSLSDAGDQAGHGVRTVAFERELAFDRVDDRLDPLANAAELAESGLLVFAVRASEDRAQLEHQRFELFAGESLVGDHGVTVEVDAREHLGGAKVKL